MLSKAKSRLITSGKKILLIFNFSFCILNCSFAQPVIQWQKCLGGTGDDRAFSIQQTNDGGYIVAGYSNSNDGDVSGNHGSEDCWIVKLNNSGTVLWQKCLGGTSSDVAYSIEQTIDGGYILGGYSWSNDGDVTVNHGGYDYWGVKLDVFGNIKWQKSFGGTQNEWDYMMQQTSDSGYVIAGGSASNDGDVAGNHGKYDYWLVKTDTSGSMQWQKCLGGAHDEYATCIQQTIGGGYIVTGWTNSSDGDVTGFHAPSDCWIVKVDNLSAIQWEECIGGSLSDGAYYIHQLNNGDYIMAGSTSSNDGDVTGNHGLFDYWIVKLDNNGIIQWQKCLGGTGTDQAASLYQTNDGGFIVTGYSNSNNGDVAGNHGGLDYWIVKLDSNGIIQWQKCLGGSNDERASSIQQTSDGGFIITGYTDSNDGDVTGNHGMNDYWIVKLSPYVSIEEETSNSLLTVSPNPFTTSTTITFSKEVSNATFSLYNLLGEKVTETSGINGTSFRFNRGNLRSGAYVFEVIEKEKSIGRGKAVIY